MGTIKSPLVGFWGIGEIGSPAQLVSTFVQRNLCQTASRKRVTAPPTLHADALMSGNSAISASTPSSRRGFNVALRTSFAIASLRSLQAGARDGLSQPPGPVGR